MTTTRRTHVDRYSRSYNVRLFSRSTGADLSSLFAGATGVALTSTHRTRGLGRDDARNVVIDYFLARGYTTDWLLDLRIEVTDPA